MDGVAVGRDRGQLDDAVLVFDPRRLADCPGASLNRLSVGLRRVRDHERDVLHPVAVAGVVPGDLVILAERGREDKPDLALLEDIGGAVADAGLRPCVGRPGEPEGVLVEVRGLLRVADPQLDVIPPVERHEIRHQAKV